MLPAWREHNTAQEPTRRTAAASTIMHTAHSGTHACMCSDATWTPLYAPQHAVTVTPTASVR
eukprot:12899973-Prorocentrum_lima.AAC.1